MTVPTGQLSNLISNWLMDKILASRDPSAVTDSSTGRMLLTYGRGYRWMVILLLAIASGCLVLGIAGSIEDSKALLIVAGIFGLFTLAMVCAFYEVTCVKLAFSRDGLYSTSSLGGQRFIPWSGVAEVAWSESFKWLKLRSGTGEAVRISIYRNGLGTLAEMAAERLEGNTEGARLIREKAAL